MKTLDSLQIWIAQHDIHIDRSIEIAAAFHEFCADEEAGAFGSSFEATTSLTAWQ